MFDQFLDFVRAESQQAVVANPDIPEEHNEAVIHAAATTVQQGVQQVYQDQGANGVKNMFQQVEQGNDKHPAVQQMSGNFMDNLAGKFGLSKMVAGGLAATLIPMLLRKMLNRGQNSSVSGFNMGSILGGLLGGGAIGGMFGGNNSNVNNNTNTRQPGGMLSNLGNSLGLDKDGDGDTDMQDLMAMFGKR